MLQHSKQEDSRFSETRFLSGGPEIRFSLHGYQVLLLARIHSVDAITGNFPHQSAIEPAVNRCANYWRGWRTPPYPQRSGGW